MAHLPGSYTNFMLNQAITKSSDTNSTVTIPGFMSESIPTGSTVTLYISVNQNGKWLLSKLSNLIEALGIYSGSALITNAWQEVSTDIGYDNNSYCNCYSISFKLPASLSECSYVLSGAVSGLDDNFGNIGQCFELRLTYNLPTGWERDVEDEAAFKTVVLSKENGWKWSSYSGTTNYLPLAGPFTYEGVNYSDVEFSYYVKEAESSNYEISSVVVNSSEYTTNGTATMAISSGNITITNKLKSQSYTLPETGGSGSRTYITFGFCVIVAASLLTLLLHRRRRT